MFFFVVGTQVSCPDEPTFPVLPWGASHLPRWSGILQDGSSQAMFFAWGRIISGVRTAKILSLEWEEKLFKPYQHVGNTMLLSKQLGGGFKHFYFHPYLRR